MPLIITIQGERYKIRENQDLGILVLRYCQRHGKDIARVVLRVARSQEVISVLDRHTTAEGVLQEGDVLTEVSTPARASLSAEGAAVS